MTWTDRRKSVGAAYARRFSMLGLVIVGVTMPGARGGLDAQVLPSLRDDAMPGAGATTECSLGAPGPTRCGVFRVWENRAAREGRTVDLRFVVLGALDPRTRHDDAVIFFVGGPGGPVTHDAARFAGTLAPLRRSRDVLLIDFRGTGRSMELRCDVPYPGGPKSRFGAIFDTAHIAACVEHLERRADLSWYRTEPAIDDTEEIRRWLGYSAINLIGASYGTREALVYRRRYPPAVRTAVLNGVVPVEGSFYLQTSSSLQIALDAILADCRTDEPCRNAYGDLETKLDEVLDRLRRAPPTVRLGGVDAVLHPGDFTYTLRGLLYHRSTEIPFWIDRGWRDDWQELVEYYLERTAWIGGDFPSGYHLSTVCAEDVAGVTSTRIDGVSAGSIEEGHLIRGYVHACALWPAASLPDGLGDPVASSVPTLLLSGSRDLVTPSHFADEVAVRPTNNRTVVIPGAGHGVGGWCVDRMVRDLIERGSLEDVDTSCVPRMRPPSFRLPSATRPGSGRTSRSSR